MAERDKGRQLVGDHGGEARLGREKRQKQLQREGKARKHGALQMDASFGTQVVRTADETADPGALGGKWA